MTDLEKTLEKFLSISLIVIIFSIVSLFTFENFIAYGQFQQVQEGLGPNLQTQRHFLEFTSINIPATAVVGQNFTLTGTITSFLPARSIDELQITITGSDNIWIEGNQLKSLGSFGHQQSEKFSFVIRPLESGQFQITLTGIGIRDGKVIATGESKLQGHSVDTFESVVSNKQLSLSNVVIPSGIIKDQLDYV